MNAHRMATVRNILIVDDHPVVREGLELLIEGQADLVVCGEAASVDEALALMSEQKPDLVIVDLSLKDSHGIDLVRRIAGLDRKIRVLVYSMHDEAFYGAAARDAGAAAYVSKNASGEETLKAIRDALDGDAPVNARRGLGRRRANAHLTPRERQVFELIGQGFATRRIAARLKISVHTVDSHRESIKKKLELDNAAALQRAATEHVIRDCGSAHRD